MSDCNEGLYVTCERRMSMKSHFGFGKHTIAIKLPFRVISVHSVFSFDKTVEPVDLLLCVWQLTSAMVYVSFSGVIS